MSDTENFGSRLRAARSKAGKSQREVAGVIDTSVAVVSRWETNSAEPSGLSRIEAIAKFLGVSPAWLAFGDSRPINRR